MADKPTTFAPQDVKSLNDVHLDDLLNEMASLGSSDLHLAVGLPPMIRKDGGLRKLNYEVFKPMILQRVIYDILNDEQIQKFEESWELDMSYYVQNLARFRVNIYKDRGNLAGAFRIIPMKTPTIEEMGLPKVLGDLCEKPRGLILVTGPTGSGKSTTLAAMVHKINLEQEQHIITIEDPVEFVHNHIKSIVNQREVGTDTKAFANALRAAMREDPDVILVGEMRDLDTMQNAIRAAETGHLVFATLHTNSASSTVDRIVDSFPAEQQEQIRLMLSNSLQAILCQQLLPRASGKGRIAAMEILLGTPAVRNLIRESKSHQLTSTIQTSGGIGMQTMDQHLKELYQSGMVTYDDAVGKAMSPEEFKAMVSSGQVKK
ncbi:MAG: type IV pilus twitching motility protein PilT [Abditibacteriota bacterium]|nr:type IV pilus twitching motility protein PilT [Abditibacteriota bacterium]MBR5740890.1 type IV pilus twitching motility protein PilT [Bacillota bacterium]